MLLRGSTESETRKLTIVGSCITLLAALGVALAVINPFQGRDEDRISITIDTPYVGQGVAAGSSVVMHGVKVGMVTAVTSLTGGGVRLGAELQRTPVAGLTDSLRIDFRPVNYFGVTGINLVPGAGGGSLRDGLQIDTVPQGNFTLQSLLSRLGAITNGAITPQLVSVVDRTTRTTDALNPLFETMVIATTALADTQTVPTAQLLRNATGLSVAFPSFTDSVTQAGDYFIDTGLDDKLSEADFHDKWLATLKEASGGLFAAFGRLESTHVDDMLPGVQTVKALTDAVPSLIKPADFGQTIVALRERFEKLYAGSPDQRALQVHIVLDSLPGVAAPINAMGGPQ